MKGTMTEKEFQDLSTYNAEIMRGIMHKIKWIEKMEKLQKLYSEEYIVIKKI